MTGAVQDLQVCIAIPVRLSDGRQVAIEFVVDTGFAGALTLPTEVAALLGLPFELELDSVLADGSAVATRVHRGTILWQGRAIDVAILAMGDRPLLGTSLLADCRLTVDFQERGLVSIATLPE